MFEKNIIDTIQFFPDQFNLKIVLLLAVGFALAGLLGYISHKAKLSPILGYLIAGYIIGPNSPGFVADRGISEQLAEIGVVLMMFGVGLHFKWQDLVNVKNIAISGAIAQTLCTTVVITLIVAALGWSVEAGIIFGLAIGVASTVVLVRLLTDNHLLKTSQGHIAIGWLIVEDMITVIALLFIPTLTAIMNGEGIAWQKLSISLVYVLVKFILLTVFMFTAGRRFIKFVLGKAKRVPHELFIVTILAITFLIATGSSLFLGISMALGAFIAGMVIGQTDVRNQVSNNTLPLKDVFVVIFFLSIGMLFNPVAIAEHFFLFLTVLATIFIIKPISAFLIVLFFKHPFKTALTLAISLAQIGEFSFILAEQAMRVNILPDSGYDIIVASSLVSISLNPLLFKLLKLNQVGSESALERKRD